MFDPFAAMPCRGRERSSAEAKQCLLARLYGNLRYNMPAAANVPRIGVWEGGLVEWYVAARLAKATALRGLAARASKEVPGSGDRSHALHAVQRLFLKPCWYVNGQLIECRV